MAIVGVGIDVVDIARFEDVAASYAGAGAAAVHRRARSTARRPRWPRASPPRRRWPRRSGAPATWPGTTPRWSPTRRAGRLFAISRHRGRPLRRARCRPRPPLPLPRRRHRLGRGGAGVLRSGPPSGPALGWGMRSAHTVEQVRAAEAALMASAARGRADAAGGGRAGDGRDRPARRCVRPPRAAARRAGRQRRRRAVRRVRCWPAGAPRVEAVPRRRPGPRGRPRRRSGQPVDGVVDLAVVHPPDVVVDGIVGIGGRPACDSRPSTPSARSRGVPIVAVDVPSGVDVDTGRLDGAPRRPPTSRSPSAPTRSATSSSPPRRPAASSSSSTSGSTCPRPP